MNYKINWYRYFGLVFSGVFLQLLFNVEVDIILSFIRTIAFLLLSIEVEELEE